MAGANTYPDAMPPAAGAQQHCSSTGLPAEDCRSMCFLRPPPQPVADAGHRQVEDRRENLIPGLSAPGVSIRVACDGYGHLSKLPFNNEENFKNSAFLWAKIHIISVLLVTSYLTSYTKYSMKFYEEKMHHLDRICRFAILINCTF